MLPQARPVHRRYPQPRDTQREVVLAAGSLLQVAKLNERPHITMRRRPAHPQLIRDVGDPTYRPLKREAGEDRQSARLLLNAAARERDR